MSPIPDDPLPTDALSMTEIRRLLGELDGAAVAERLGQAFLLYHAPTGSGAGASFLGRTMAIEDPSRKGTSNATETLVFPVRPSGRSLFPNFISVGRAAKNDIIIPDPSLSKFHAYFRQNDDGGFSLLDAGSHNGTFLDDKPVPAQNDGEPVPVSTGCRVRFGGATCTFLSLDALRTVATMARDMI